MGLIIIKTIETIPVAKKPSTITNIILSVIIGNIVTLYQELDLTGGSRFTTYILAL
jgi:hypothetical protein